MNWTFHLLRVAGIDIRVHVTFFLILLLGAFQWGGPHGLPGAAFGVLLMLALFACVTLHELGHSLVAKHFHVRVRQIVLLPIGGVALIERNPDRPLHELLIAAAGPAVNVVIAAVLLAVTGQAYGLTLLDGRGLVEGQLAPPSPQSFLLWLLAANVMLVLFNLIPAFPLDGGRMLRAVLAMATDYRRATRLAAGVGQLIAIALGLVGVLGGNLLLALVAVFIFFGAGFEASQVEARSVLTTLRVGDAYNKHALVLSPGDRVSRVVDYILTSYQPDFAVVQGDRLLGVVTRADVLRALAREEGDPYVAGIMERDVPRVEEDTPLDRVQELMGEKGARIVAVQRGESLLGLVSREDLAEALAVVSFVRQHEDRERARAAAG